MSRISAMAQITFLELQTTVLGNFCPWIQNFSVHSVSYHRLAANTRGEQMFSALPPKPDIAQCSRHVRNVPNSEVTKGYSITLSARASSDVGSSRSSAFAVFKLMISSYLVGAWTGRSAGFAPLRIRST